MKNNNIIKLSVNGSNKEEIKVEDMREMFSECKSIESLDLSMMNTSNVKNMKEMFYKCKKLKEIKLPKDVSKVEDMSEMFNGCSKLKKLIISCNKLTDILTDFKKVGVKKKSLFFGITRNDKPNSTYVFKPKKTMHFKSYLCPYCNNNFTFYRIFHQCSYKISQLIILK